MFEGIDFSDFWKDGEWADSYLSDPVTDEMIQSVEEELGYKLPESYIALMRQHNGGCPKKNFVKVLVRSSKGYTGSDGRRVTLFAEAQVIRTGSMVGDTLRSGFPSVIRSPPGTT